jgi:PAS domain S-box-containing protein
MYCVAKDATEKKREEALHQLKERRLHRALKLAGMAWWELDIASQTYLSSDEIFYMYGLPIPEGNRTTVSEFLSYVHPDDMPRLQHDLATLCNDTYFHYEHRIVKPTGEVVYVVHYSELIRDEAGNAVALHGTTQDITERKLKEEAERLAQERYRLLFYESPLPKWIFDEETLRFVEVNDAAIQHYGWSREEFLAMTILDIRPETERARVLKIHNEHRGRLEFRFMGVLKHRKKCGTLIDVEVATNALEQQGRLQVVVVATDVTEKLQAEKEKAKAILKAQERERSVIGKELHDNVNQVLTTAKLYVENVGYYPEQGHSFLERGVDLIQKSIQEIRSLSKALITPTLSDHDFRSALEELITHYRDLQLFDVTFHYDLNENVFDKDLKLTIYRLLQELFNNTVKYAKATQVGVRLRCNSRYIQLAYQDNGIGFNESEVRRGLGLNNIRNRVEMFKGRVRFNAKPGAGSQTLAVFPASHLTS